MQRGLVTALGQLMMKKMVGDLEIRIIFERRMREVERRKHQALPEARKQRQSALHVIAQLREIDRAFEGREPGKMERSAFRFAIQERGILRGQSMGEFCGLHKDLDISRAPLASARLQATVSDGTVR